MGATPARGHYFDAEPSTPSKRRHVSLVLPDVTLSLTSDSGVFARDAVDAGTKLLLLDGGAPAPGAVDLVDLGCGYGPIALTLAHRNRNARVWAVDVNTRARELCRDNATANDVANVTVVPPDDVPAHIGVTEIWSNPPVRIGKAALHELLATWLERLVDGGRAVLVVQKHLGADSLRRWLDDTGWPADVLSSRSGYRVIEVKRPA